MEMEMEEGTLKEREETVEKEILEATKEEKVAATKETLLQEILAHKQTAASLLEKFGYQEERIGFLKELEAEGKIKIVEGFQKGSRLFFVKPDFDVASLKKKEAEPSKKVKKYLGKKQEEIKKNEGEEESSVEKEEPTIKKQKKIKVTGEKKVSKASIIKRGLDNNLSIEDIIKEVAKVFPLDDIIKIRHRVHFVKCALKKKAQ